MFWVWALESSACSGVELWGLFWVLEALTRGSAQILEVKQLRTVAPKAHKMHPYYLQAIKI